MLYRLFFSLVLTRIDPERAHALAARGLRLTLAIPGARALARRLLVPDDPALRVRALGVEFASPLGVAAGMDKDAGAFADLLALGFGFVEVGTVTSVAQPGNPRPRVFRLPRARAIVNAMGFPNPGAEAVARRLARRPATGVVGANIGKTRAIDVRRIGEDYRASAAALAPRCDYLVVNVSSPNTPGLLDMQDVPRLTALIADVKALLATLPQPPPLLIKLGPDLPGEEIDALADLAVDLELDGIVAVNTTIDRAVLDAASRAAPEAQRGGISGVPLAPKATETLRRLRARVGDRLVLISVGGIDTPQEAWRRIQAGATLVQAYTGFVYGGPLWPARMNRGLSRLVAEAGVTSIQDAVASRHEPREYEGDPR